MTRRQKCEHLLNRLLDQVEKQLPEAAYGQSPEVPLERLPSLAETLRQLVEAELMLTSQEEENQPND